MIKNDFMTIRSFKSQNSKLSRKKKQHLFGSNLNDFLTLNGYSMSIHYRTLIVKSQGEN